MVQDEQDYLVNPVNLVNPVRRVVSSALDGVQSGLYSLPFRTNSLKHQKQRPVGSVGVEALLDHRQYGR